MRIGDNLGLAVVPHCKQYDRVCLVSFGIGIGRRICGDCQLVTRPNNLCTLPQHSLNNKMFNITIPVSDKLMARPSVETEAECRDLPSWRAVTFVILQELALVRVSMPLSNSWRNLE